MTTLDTAIAIDAPIEGGWAILTDPSAYADRNPDLIRAKGKALAGSLCDTIGAALRAIVEANFVCCNEARRNHAEGAP